MNNLEIGFNYGGDEINALEKISLGYENVIFFEKQHDEDGGNVALTLDEAEFIADELLRLVNRVRSTDERG